jgi:predicted small metal-binding protein
MSAPSTAQATRKYIDCSEYPSDSNCTLKISGKEEEVLPVAAQHAAAVHGHEDTPEMWEKLRGFLKDE